MNKAARKVLQFFLIVGTVALSIWLLRTYGFDVETLRLKVKSLGILAPLVFFGLRFISVVIPIVPGTAFAFASGLTLGLTEGLLVIVLADFLSCSLSFYLSRRYGRGLVEQLIGQRFMNRVDRLGQQHLERNFPLLTAFLMTGFFDFVSYGAGLTQTAWSRFLGALCISIPIAHTPAVIVGANLLEKRQSYGLLGIALAIAFGVALITGMLQRKGAASDERSR
ncbi:TVP38/TMEM64 family protein [Altericista sp. CCNU0014]|uniref:TVP38/TMEM64 family protein n=1 Tax=Altericista sp. CCNU0014 TaxID=3082949 RepID=UPI00385048B4